MPRVTVYNYGPGRVGVFHQEKVGSGEPALHFLVEEGEGETIDVEIGGKIGIVEPLPEAFDEDESVA